jgi:hypothetical protein
MKTFAVGVHDFALENLSTTLQALRDVFDSFVPRVYPPQPNRCTSWHTLRVHRNQTVPGIDLKQVYTHNGQHLPSSKICLAPQRRPK